MPSVYGGFERAVTERGVPSDSSLAVSRTVRKRASMAMKCLPRPLTAGALSESCGIWGTRMASGPHIWRRTGSGLRICGWPPWGSSEGPP